MMTTPAERAWLTPFRFFFSAAAGALPTQDRPVVSGVAPALGDVNGAVRRTPGGPAIDAAYGMGAVDARETLSLLKHSTESLDSPGVSLRRDTVCRVRGGPKTHPHVRECVFGAPRVQVSHRPKDGPDSQVAWDKSDYDHLKKPT